MTSLNKKKKAKNSFLYNGGEKNNGSRLKRIQYFTKQDRRRTKSVKEEEQNETDN